MEKRLELFDLKGFVDFAYPVGSSWFLAKGLEEEFDVGGFKIDDALFPKREDVCVLTEVIGYFLLSFWLFE